MSPYTLQGEHDQSELLGEDVVEAVHRLRTDADRIPERWVHEITAGSLDEQAYVELIGIVAVLTALDTLDLALGRPPSGMNVFVVKSVSGIPMRGIYQGILPFWAAMFVCLAISVAVPQLSLILPGAMGN